MSNNVQSSSLNTQLEVRNLFEMYVLIGGTIKLETKSGQIIHYKEEIDYIENEFPIRVLTIQVQAPLFHQILNTKRVGDKFPDWFDIELSTRPVDSSKTNLLPFDDGKFIGRLMTGDSTKSLTNIYSNNTKELLEMNKPSSGLEELTFALYRESEITFNKNQSSNLCFKNPTLEDVFLSSFFSVNPNLNIIFSDFHNNSVLCENFMIPSKPFPEIIELLENEVGFYLTDYNMFMENNILYFLNKEDDIRCSNRDLSSTLSFIIQRQNDDKVSEVVNVKDLMNLGFTIGQKDMSTSTTVKKVFNTSYIYVNPNGETFYHNYDVSRETKTIRKITNAIPTKQLGNITYETIKIKLSNLAFNKYISPLTKLIIKNDSTGQDRIYRLKSKTVVMESNISLKCIIEGFRVVK